MSSRRLQGWIVALAIPVVFVAGFVVLRTSRPVATGPGETVRVPAVVGLSSGEAISRIEAAGLVPVVRFGKPAATSAQSADVYETVPPKDTSLGHGSQVVLLVAMPNDQASTDVAAKEFVPDQKSATNVDAAAGALTAADETPASDGTAEPPPPTQRTPAPEGTSPNDKAPEIDAAPPRTIAPEYLAAVAGAKSLPVLLAKGRSCFGKITSILHGSQRVGRHRAARSPTRL